MNQNISINSRNFYLLNYILQINLFLIHYINNINIKDVKKSIVMDLYLDFYQSINEKFMFDKYYLIYNIIYHKKSYDIIINSKIKHQ